MDLVSCSYGSPSTLKSSACGSPDVDRRSADYHPSVWGDHFLTATPNVKKPDASTEQRIEELKEEVKRMLEVGSGTSQQMDLINTLQRLGVSYHFETEIEEALDQIYGAPIECSDYDLYATALRFRLLRQHGHNVPSDVFRKFKDEKGEFKESLTKDAKGLLSLYEAAHLGTKGEDILDEAITFSSKHLRLMMTNLSSPLRKQIEHALELPLYKSMPRLEVRHYILIYKEDEAHNPALVELAKLDFAVLQYLHQTEIRQLAKWWKDINIASQLPFVRDRLVECYFWILGVYFEPQYSQCRIFVTKLINIASVIDDIYDVYGTLEELQLFTDAIDRWDLGALDHQPSYMKVCLLALFNAMKEVEDALKKEGRLYRVYYAKEAMKALTRAYFTEAKWFHSGYIPPFEEYLEVSVQSSGYPMLVVQSLICMGKEATKEAFDWVITVPKIVWSTGLIARLVDDIQTNKVEQERGDNACSVQCYMKEYNVSEKVACKKIREMIGTAWKDINKEWLKPTPFPRLLLMPALNLTRMMEVLYQHGDGYSNSTGCTKDRISSLLVEPLPI